MMKLTVEEENILAMMDVSTKTEMVEDLKNALENTEDAEMLTLIARCVKRVKHMADDELESLVLTAAEDI